MLYRFVHFGVLFIAKYWNGENSAASPNFKKIPLILKSSDIGLKKPGTSFKKLCFLGSKSPKLKTLVYTNVFAPPGNFSPYENCLKIIVYTLMADFPYRDKI
jgi:hypothetical protein